MNPRQQTILTGLASGLIQGNLLLVFAALLASHAVEIAELGPAWEAAIFTGVSISLVVGIILEDAYDTVKALLLSLVVALAFSMPLVNLLGISITASPEQGYAEAIFFGLLTPAVLFVGMLAGIAGTMTREFSPIKPRNPMARRRRNVLLLLSIIVASLFGFYVFSVVTEPNFSVAAQGPVSLRSNCFSFNGTCTLVPMRFNVTVSPVRGYTGTVTIVIPNFPGYRLCSTVNLPKERSSSCQASIAFSPGVYLFQYRATDGSIAHDFYVQVNVS